MPLLDLSASPLMLSIFRTSKLFLKPPCRGICYGYNNAPMSQVFRSNAVTETVEEVYNITGAEVENNRHGGSQALLRCRIKSHLDWIHHMSITHSVGFSDAWFQFSVLIHTTCLGWMAAVVQPTSRKALAERMSQSYKTQMNKWSTYSVMSLENIQLHSQHSRNFLAKLVERYYFARNLGKFVIDLFVQTLA